MTVDDLVALVEDLTSGMKVSDLRQMIDYKPLLELSDQSYMTLVGFVGGQRPGFNTNPQVRLVDTNELQDFDRRMEFLEVRELESVTRDPGKPLELGGSFDGIELP